MFSKATEYALRATIFIAQKGSEMAKLGIDEIAQAIDSPKSFTAKILQLLSRDNHIVSSVRGPNGGFYLTEKAKQLPISTILQAMGEEERLEKCVMGLKQCSETKPCPMHLQFKPIRKQLKELFESKSIQEFAAEIKDGVIFISNQPH
ncbi:MAG: Rrf2 family transcriptional regulator [Chitinophagaceae bacterium]|nr:Rrf2 family transcriptional regulator [Chitinophagaceae bacterium]MEA3425124.1 Rrf2 family transcriptional regulator [Bacteroidota bacterium]MCA6452439.1 Rrf2 family transcriptional regulator [Chitinophagaceae bacterium]MCA6457292.1 Rrf2 family transcriptional regulator [Chitinophagaceae bacterium]MCA6459539.1 Rrf2 family transcriptional regulator [Chitinophagaceae bacterium]